MAKARKAMTVHKFMSPSIEQSVKTRDPRSEVGGQQKPVPEYPQITGINADKNK